MKEIYSASAAHYCWLLKGILEDEGIACEVQNESLGQVSGCIPFDQTWPKLCVVNDEDFEEARRIVGEHAPKLSDLPSFCPECDSDEIELQKTGTLIEFDRFKCKKCGFTWDKS